MPPIRLKSIRGTLASFAVDLFAGRCGAVTNSTPGPVERWGWHDGTQWRFAASQGADETFSGVAITGLASNSIPKIGAGFALDESLISDDGAEVAVNGRLAVNEGATMWNAPTMSAQPLLTGGRGASVTMQNLFAVLAQYGLIGDLTTTTNLVREAIIQPLPITNSAPDVVNVVDANMKSFGFDGNTTTEELFYHCDTQHDYLAGGDMLFHVHWMPATATGGNVRWQIHYQWVEAGGVFPAASLLGTTTAAGTTAWADKVTSFTIPGTGHTYNSRLMIRLFRDPTDALDTYTGDAVLSSVGMHYAADPGQG